MGNKFIKGDPSELTPSWIFLFAYLVSGAMIMGALLFPLFHEIVRAVPLGAAAPESTSNSADPVASSFLQMIFFLTSVEFGLVAVVGFSLSRGLRNGWLRIFNVFGLAFFTSCVLIALTFAFDALGKVVVQLDFGKIYLTILNDDMKKIASFTLISASIAIVVAAVNLAERNE